MADAAPEIHIGENSPEKIAYDLFERVAAAERKQIRNVDKDIPGWSKADRKWILDTYAECLEAVRVPNARL